MNQLNHSSQKATRFSRIGITKLVFAGKLSAEWKILFALLALMGLRLVTIIVVVLKQL